MGFGLLVSGSRLERYGIRSNKPPEIALKHHGHRTLKGNPKTKRMHEKSGVARRPTSHSAKSAGRLVVFAVKNVHASLSGYLGGDTKLSVPHGRKLTFGD